MTELVPINTATPERLLALYGVGDKLAAEIVRHRGVHGCFTGPADLARVRGIGARRAHVLAPAIDFSLPPAVPKRRNWRGFLAGAASVPVVAAALVHPMATRLGEEVRAGWYDAADVAGTGMFGAMAAMGVFAMAFPAAVAARELSRDPARASRFARWAHRSVVLMLAALLAGLAAMFARAALAGPGVLRGLLSQPHPWVMLAMSAHLLLLLGAPLLAGSRGALEGRRLAVARLAHDAARLLGAPVIALAVTLSREWMPGWMAVAYALLGLHMLRRAIVILRTGRSEFDPAAYAFPAPPAGRTDPAEAVAWLESVRPDPEFRRALARGLAAEQRKRLRGGVLAVSALWILTVAVEAVLEMGVQELLASLLCSLGIWCG